MRCSAIVSVSVALALGCSGLGCGESRNRATPSGSDEAASAAESSPEVTAYVKSLREASTDQERWEATMEAYRSIAHRQTAEDLEEFTKRQVVWSIVVCFPDKTWLEHYPSITRRVRLQPDDLLKIGASLGSAHKARWCTTGPGFRAINVSAATQGEMAAGWLRHLTGVQFSDSAGFAEWYGAHEERLEWDQQQGRFALRNDRPSSTGPARTMGRRMEGG